MRNAFRPEKILWFLLVLTVPAFAQNGWQSSPTPAVTGPSYDASLGYTSVRMAIPGLGSVNMNGIAASASVGLASKWSAIVESSYARTPNVLGTNHQGYMLNSQVGPAFYPWEHRNTRVFVRGLAGMALIDGAIPSDKNTFFHGWLMRPSFTFGGGVEQAIAPQFMIRVNADYLRTSFYDPAGVEQGQNNIRATVSLVFRLKEHQHRSSSQAR
jgi:hypothetical protein